MKISSTPNANVQRCLNPRFQNQCPLFLLSPLFRISQLSGQDQRNGKGKYYDYRTSPSVLTSSIHTFIFPWTPQGFISPEHLLNFLSDVYTPSMAEVSVQTTGKCICESKNRFWSFLLMPPRQKSPPGSYHHQSGRGKLL